MDIGRLRTILRDMAKVRVAVVGDFFLDEYLIIDPALDEPSLETGLTAHQVVRRERAPGAAGTVAKDLANLGVGAAMAVGFAGDDGRGRELVGGLTALGVDCGHLTLTGLRVTPTYTKPLVMEGGALRELSRLDIRNRDATPAEVEEKVMEGLAAAAKACDAVAVMDQVVERSHGAVTDRVRGLVGEVGLSNSGPITYADSRGNIGLFVGCIVKGNAEEMVRAATGVMDALDPGKPGLRPDAADCAKFLSLRSGMTAIVTMGASGALLADCMELTEVPAFRVEGPTDVCGAGDAFTAGFIGSLAAGADMAEAALVGNLAAAECVSQVGTTGTITPESMLRRMEAHLRRA